MNFNLLLDKKNWSKLFYVYKLNSNNESFESAYNCVDEKVKVYGFYHAYCQCESWDLLVKEQLEHIISSGLYERINKLYVGALILDKDIPLLNSLIETLPKIEILYLNNDRSMFEYPTLIALQKKCAEEDFIGFYFHTKGISWITKPTVYKVGITWRLMSEFFMFDKYRIAIHALNSGYVVYGTNYQEIFNDAFRIVGGNFFWFKSEYVKTLYELKVNREDRNESEKWILSNTHNVYDPFKFSGNSRNDAIPKEFYLPSSSLKRFLLTIIVYFGRFKYLIRRLLGLKVDLINPNGVVQI